MPLDIRAAGTDYFTAAAALSKLAYVGTPVNSVANAPIGSNSSGLSMAPILVLVPFQPTQNVYEFDQPNLGNETTRCFNSTCQTPKQELALMLAATVIRATATIHDQYSALYAGARSASRTITHMEVTFAPALPRWIAGRPQLHLLEVHRLDIAEPSGCRPPAATTTRRSSIAGYQDNCVAVSDFGHDSPDQCQLGLGSTRCHGRHWLVNQGRVVNGILGNWDLQGLPAGPVVCLMQLTMVHAGPPTGTSKASPLKAGPFPPLL
jgi:hypothetical protein